MTHETNVPRLVKWLGAFGLGAVVAAWLFSPVAAANGNDAQVEDTALPYMVLPVADLGDEFANYQVDPQSGFDREEDRDPGEINAYSLFYTKAGSADPFEASLPATFVVLYTDAAAAHTAVADGVGEFQRGVEDGGGTFEMFELSDLGDEAVVVTGSFEFKGFGFRDTVVVFRSGRLLGAALIERDDLGNVEEQTVGIARALLGRMQGAMKGNTTELPAVLPADLNGDGAVDSIDATLVLQLSAELVNSLPYGFLGDANGNGQIDAVDATIILQFDAGLIWKFSGASLSDPTKAGLSHLVPGVTSPATSTAGPAMAVDCNAQAEGVQDSCSYSSGQTFDVAVDVLEPPPDGYLGFQVKLSGNGGVLAYLPARDPRDETLWPGCLLPMHSDYAPSRPTALFACVDVDLPVDDGLSGPVEPLITPPASTDTGAILQFRFRCNRVGETALVLEPRDSDDGTFFLGPDYQTFDAELTAARVSCM